MQEVNIKKLIEYGTSKLIKNIPNNIIIVGKIDKITIRNKYDQLDLSKVKCKEIYYYNQEGDSIKNHILPNSLKELNCRNNQLTLLPNLPNSLIELDCESNKLTLLPDLPNSLELLSCSENQLLSLSDLPYSLKYLYCSHNQLTSIPDLPNSLEILYCSHNQLLSLPDLPNSLWDLLCDDNQLSSLPDFTHIDHKLKLGFIQDTPIKYIPYNINIELYIVEPNKIIIEGYPHNPITNQNELDQYMDYIKNYRLNRIKSARK